VAQSALPPFPYTLVDIDEPDAGSRASLRYADPLQWKLWIVKYAWFLSLVTAAPGIALIIYTVTGNLGFSLAITAMATLTPAATLWARMRKLK